MKKLLIIIFCITTFNLSANTSLETQFWNKYLKGNYKEASILARKISEDKNEYYMMATICHYQLNEYNAQSFTKKLYNARSSNIKLKKILEKKKEENKKNFRIYILMGITKKLMPSINIQNSKIYFTQSIKLNSKDPFGYNELSMALIAEKNYELSIKYAKKAISLKPDFPEPYNNLAYCYSKVKLKEKAISTLIECMEKCHKVPSNTFVSLMYLTCIEAVNTVAPHGNMYMLGVPVFRNRNVLHRLIKLRKIQPRNYLDLVDFFLSKAENKQFNISTKEMMVSKELIGYHAYVKATFYHLEGDKKNFHKEASILLKSDFKQYGKTLKIANIYMEMRDSKNALKFYLKALKGLDKLDSEYKMKLHSNIGGCYIRMKNIPKAIFHMNKALEVKQDDTITLVNMGILHFRNNQKQKAKIYFQKALHSTHNPRYRKLINNWMERIRQ